MIKLGDINSIVEEDSKIVDWGFTNELTPKSYDHYLTWVNKGHHGNLSYLGDHRKDARKDLKSVFPEVESAVVFLFTYHPQKLALEEFYHHEKNWNGLKIASYTLGFEGEDYHLKVKERLFAIGNKLKESYSNLEFKLSLDIHPVLERDLAYRSGLGWFGKNSMLISREFGSYTIIGSLLLNKKIDGKEPILETDHCGQCRACVEACPTDAINEGSRTLMADRCISTWTIELFKEGTPAPKGMDSSQGEFFGCDICQEVCPWNKRPVRTGLSSQGQDEFQAENSLILNEFLKSNIIEKINELEESSNSGFAKKFKTTPLGRTGRRGLLKNLYFWKKP